MTNVENQRWHARQKNVERWAWTMRTIGGPWQVRQVSASRS
jgi:hypothetical protein